MSQDHPYEVPIRRPLKDAYVKFVYVDAGGTNERTFESVHVLAEFLKYNQEFAKMVGYVPKQRR